MYVNYEYRLNAGSRRETKVPKSITTGIDATSDEQDVTKKTAMFVWHFHTQRCTHTRAKSALPVKKTVRMKLKEMKAQAKSNSMARNMEHRINKLKCFCDAVPVCMCNFECRMCVYCVHCACY